jgi:hypothetical protein
VRGYIFRLLNDNTSFGEVTLELVPIPFRGRSQQSTSQISCLFQYVLCFTCFVSLGTSQPLATTIQIILPKLLLSTLPIINCGMVSQRNNTRKQRTRPNTEWLG